MPTTTTTTVQLSPGDEVEMVDTLVATDAARLRAYQVLGNERPAGSVNGRDYFGVFIGEKARILGLEGNAIHVEFLDGNWKGRDGWVALDAIRVPPSEADSSADFVEGLPLLARRQIYASINAAGSAATAEAGSRFPFDRMPAEEEACRSYLAERNAVYQAAKEKGWAELVASTGLGVDQLERIEAEGDRERWPLWDGLADERGPIPTFGPGRTDERGRLLISDDEREARRDASIRALAALGKITDETDTEEVWAEVSRNLERAH